MGRVRRIRISRDPPDDALAAGGRGVDLHLLVDDLDEAADALAGTIIERGEMEGVGSMLTVHCGIALTVGERTRAPHADTPAVQPIWFAPDLVEPRRILESLGLRPAIASDAGGWVELHAPGGGAVGLHHGDRHRVGLSFLTDDVEGLAARLREEGYAASVVDEAFTRTVRLPDPDGGDDIWINGAQTDLHGYHRVS